MGNIGEGKGRVIDVARVGWRSGHVFWDAESSGGDGRVDSRGNSEACPVGGNKFGIRKGGEVGIGVPRHLEAMVPKSGIFKAFVDHTTVIAGRECYRGSSKDWWCWGCNGRCGMENRDGWHPQRYGRDWLCSEDRHPQR
jgi:hypothetical protein